MEIENTVGIQNILQGTNIDGYIIEKYITQSSEGYIYLSVKNNVFYVLKIQKIEQNSHFKDYINEYSAYKAIKEYDLNDELILNYVSLNKEIQIGQQKLQFMVTENMEDGDLFQFYQKYKKQIQNDPNLLMYYFQQILQGLKIIHASSYCHLDIKPQNILVSNNGQTLKIGDFGHSMPLNQFKNNIVYRGTVKYQPQEMKAQFQYQKLLYLDGKKCDLFSAGVTFFNLVFNMFPPCDIKKYNEDFWQKTYEYCNIKFTQEQKEFYQNLFDFILSPDPDDRYSIEEYLDICQKFLHNYEYKLQKF